MVVLVMNKVELPEHILIKFIPEEKYCQNLLNDGEILLSCIDKFIDSSENGRGDPNEFVELNKGFSIYVKEQNNDKYVPLLLENNIIGPMRNSTDYFIYSMYYTTRERLKYIDEKNIDDFASGDKKNLYGVMFDYFKFTERLENWLKDNKFCLESGLVKYEDIKDENKWKYFFNSESKYRKDYKYHHQNEYRFIVKITQEFKKEIDPKLNGMLIKIGSLKDIGIPIQLRRR